MVLLLVPMTGASIDIYVPSLPNITQALQASTHLVQLTIPLYLLGYGLSQAFCGALSDALGRKSLLMAGLVLFIIASVVVPFSPNVYFLMAMRALQGVGVAAPGVLARAIVSDSFDKEQLPKITNYMTTAWAAGPILAPVLGSYLQTYLSWHASYNC